MQRNENGLRVLTHVLSNVYSCLLCIIIFFSGNFFAVGTMFPVVEIWDIDLVDAPAPIRVLGVMEKKSKKKTSKKKVSLCQGLLQILYLTNHD